MAIKFNSVFSTSGDIEFADRLGIGIAPNSGARLTLPKEDDAATPTLAFGDGDTGFYQASDNEIRIALGGVLQFGIKGSKIQGASASAFGLINENASATNPTMLPDTTDEDTGIGQAAADQLSLIAGAIEGIRITEVNSIITVDIDAGDNGTGQVGCLTSIKSNEQAITSSAAATLTATGLIPAGVFVIGITARVTTGFGTSTGLTDFDVGDGSDVDRWANSLGITAGTTMDLANNTSGPFGATGTSALNVVLTAVGGNFDGTGVIQLIAHYIELTPPTS